MLKLDRETLARNFAGNKQLDIGIKERNQFRFCF